MIILIILTIIKIIMIKKNNNNNNRLGSNIFSLATTPNSRRIEHMGLTSLQASRLAGANPSLLWLDLASLADHLG
ncbi:hypothetical protein POPTR_008G182350v4 [Populus trichocarpa]|jgi:hypothetical protein|uniref:Uncharacterized protein n=1 Tax=Populus trichocarpa TaxID=3694 RepID=A0ACC0SMP4_POPTR|nr:hypothetical protein BDE02_08G165300 [Populus trichocarpa]KAI9390455.1 hypothetical protein POPTR_008G182350v4 [Populus trichocarpa]